MSCYFWKLFVSGNKNDWEFFEYCVCVGGVYLSVVFYLYWFWELFDSLEL